MGRSGLECAEVGGSGLKWTEEGFECVVEELEWV